MPEGTYQSTNWSLYPADGLLLDAHGCTLTVSPATMYFVLGYTAAQTLTATEAGYAQAIALAACTSGATTIATESGGGVGPTATFAVAGGSGDCSTTASDVYGLQRTR